MVECARGQQQDGNPVQIFERNPGIRGQSPLIHPRLTTDPLIFVTGIQESLTGIWESRTLFNTVAGPSGMCMW